MKAGRLEKACPELQASLDLVRDSGTKGALARCHGLSGRVASAWLLWRELADTAPNAALRTDAAAQAARLESRLPRYTIKRATRGVAVQINGRDVAGTVAIAVPIDPGKVAVTAVGREGTREVTETWTHDYTAVEGQTLAIEIPALAPLAPAPLVRPIEEPARPSSELADRRHRRHVVAVVIGTVALGVAAGSTVLGLDARAKFADAKDLCDGDIKQCPSSQVAASQAKVDDARNAATLSTIGFGVAGAAAVTAVILWATAPSLEHRVAIAPSISAHSAGLVLGGAF